MMSIEPRNEPRMLRWFRKTYPSYNLQPLLLKHRELEEARSFNNWLGERRQAQEGQRHLDDVSRLTEAVRRQVPQLRYARAERRGVERAADEVAQQDSMMVARPGGFDARQGCGALGIEASASAGWRGSDAGRECDAQKRK